jgi:hypothetical protein
VGQPCCGYDNCLTGCCVNDQCIAVGAGCDSSGVRECAGPNTCAYCGVAGTAPCSDGQCKAGTCLDAATGRCVAPGTAGPTADTVCRNGVFQACGGSAQPCCAGSVCANDGCCASDRCAPKGMPCSTSVPGVCSSAAIGGCGACGGHGQPCCEVGYGAPFCTGAGLACTEDNAALDGTCERCGGPGEPCCRDGMQNGLCEGQGCCFNDLCVAAGSPCGSSVGVCDSGMCRTSEGLCGGINHGCSGLGCIAPYSDGHSTCEPCGLRGLDCCYHDACAPGLSCSSSKCN